MTTSGEASSAAIYYYMGAGFRAERNVFLDNRCQGTGTCLIGSCQGSFLGLDQNCMGPTPGQALDLFILDDGISDTGGLLRDAHLATWRPARWSLTGTGAWLEMWVAGAGGIAKMQGWETFYAEAGCSHRQCAVCSVQHVVYNGTMSVVGKGSRDGTAPSLAHQTPSTADW